MSFEDLCASLVKAMSLTTHRESTLHPAHARTFYVVARDRFAVEQLERWYNERRAVLGASMELREDAEEELGSVALILRRPVCRFCRTRWDNHAPEGGKCLFGATSYKEIPYPI